LDLRGLRARLACLSACSTGIIDTELPDEMVALPAALTQAGFAGVIASLWPVSDASTAMLMAQFYAHWLRSGLSPTLALRSARIMVRDVTNDQWGDWTSQSARTASRQLSHKPSGSQGGDAVADSQFPFWHPYWWAAFYITGV